MDKQHKWLPKSGSITISKVALLDQLQTIDKDTVARQRVLAMENQFRQRIDSHIASLPRDKTPFAKFNTSPFVLLMHARQKGYSRISDIERDIIPAKLFSSMETSAGRMIEEIVLPAYGWECVVSNMHSSHSILDGRKIENQCAKLITLKSGPRCLNDEMSANLADDILNHFSVWSSG